MTNDIISVFLISDVGTLYIYVRTVIVTWRNCGCLTLYQRPLLTTWSPTIPFSL